MSLSNSSWSQLCFKSVEGKDWETGLPIAANGRAHIHNKSRFKRNCDPHQHEGCDSWRGLLFDDCGRVEVTGPARATYGHAHILKNVLCALLLGLAACAGNTLESNCGRETKASLWPSRDLLLQDTTTKISPFLAKSEQLSTEMSPAAGTLLPP